MQPVILDQYLSYSSDGSPKRMSTSTYLHVNHIKVCISGPPSGIPRESLSAVCPDSYSWGTETLIEHLNHGLPLHERVDESALMGPDLSPMNTQIASSARLKGL